MKFQTYLRNKLKKHNLTQGKFATLVYRKDKNGQKIPYNRVTVSRWCNGRIPDIEAFFAIASAISILENRDLSQVLNEIYQLVGLPKPEGRK